MAGSSKKASAKSPKRKRQAAASDTQSSSKSPRKTRQAAASDAQSPSKSPKRTQQGKATMSETGSGDSNNEDYNKRSLERTKLLTKIKGIVNNAPVSPAFWACCQLADMNRLQSVAKWEEEVILGYEDSLASIPLKCELLGF